MEFDGWFHTVVDVDGLELKFASSQLFNIAIS